ncbi:MAG: AAA family ATPase [Clostridia bacterium]|nr:AAA family ATPase [Clostridia bacterium]
MTHANYTKQINKIAEILDLGATKKSNENLQMLCPFHSESNPSFGINFKTGAYNCFSCGTSGHINNLSNCLNGNIIANEVENILQYKIKTLIDGIGYKEKPSSKEFENIINRIDIQENFREYSIKDIISLIVNGHMIVPAGIRKNTHWKEQQIIMLDFDNKETNFTREEILEYASSIDLLPTFSYYTFSHLTNKDKKEKFRLVYCFEEPITDQNQIKCIINYLFHKFKSFRPDPQCKNLSSKFLGTNNNSIELYNLLYKPYNRYTEEQLKQLDLLFQNEEQLKIKKINYASINDLLKTKLPPLNIIVDNLLYQGLSIMAGSPKVGKSWACLNLCIAICQGKSFLGFKTNKCDCLYLALEDSDRRIQNRVNKILKGEPLPSGFYYSIKCSSLDTGLIDELESYMREKPNTKLIIIDTLQKIRGNQNRSDSYYSYDYKEIGKLKEFADKRKICILVIHHLRKMKDNDVFNQISGSTGLTGSADTMIVLSKSENTNEVELSITGRDVESVEKIIKFNTESFQWEVLYNVEERTEEMLYKANPIAITIKKMVSVNPEGYKTTSNDLLKTIKEFTGTNPKQNTPQALTRYINTELQYLLLKYDNIHYTPPNKNGGSNGRKMFFTKVITEQDTSIEENNI